MLLGLCLGLIPAQVSAAQSTAVPNSICPAELPEAIAQITRRPAFTRMRWGILVQTLGHEETLYAEDADQYFIPASNAKLLTTAAALTALGADFRIRTSVYQSTDPATGLNRLILVGRGDPSLSDTQLRNLATQIRHQGITQIDQLVANDQYFTGDAVNPNWEWEDIQAGYGAPVNSLNLNGNAIALSLFPQALGEPLRVVWADSAEAQQWRIDNRSRTVSAGEPEFVSVGRDLSQPVLYVQGQLQVGSNSEDAAIAIPDPTSYALRRFRQILTDAGISVRYLLTTSIPLPNDATEVAFVLSPPLSELLVVANQDSDNLYAETLLRIVGVNHQPSPDQANSSLDAGIEAIATTLANLGVDPESYALADGSGLSRHNLISPAALVQTLQAMARSPQAALYRNSLAVAGVSGTLQYRFRNTAVAEHLYGKTGALSGVAALSGYLDPPNYPPVVFSILVNQFNQPVRTIRPTMDEIVLHLARLQPCSS